MVNPLLTVADLTVERGGRVVLSKLSFNLDAGDSILVSGRNGAGKSTLLRTIAGLLPSQAGRIAFGLANAEVRGVETVHYFGYEDALKPSLTVGENLAFWASMLGAPSYRAKRRRDAHVLGRPSSGDAEDEPGVQEHHASDGTSAVRSLGAVLLDPGPSLGSPEDDGREASRSRPTPSAVPLHRFAGENLSPKQALAAFGIARLIDLPGAYLSAGQKRRVALARLLLAARPIWLLDEPLIALDSGAQATMMAIMAGHVSAGGAILVASHQRLAVTCRQIDLDA